MEERGSLDAGGLSLFAGWAGIAFCPFTGSPALGAPFTRPQTGEEAPVQQMTVVSHTQEVVRYPALKIGHLNMLAIFFTA